ncbi:MAG: regulatory protein NosR [Proteobacteria bacterium]|nr:regulatory protein NosR [Pseudomonadota bacterium]
MTTDAITGMLPTMHNLLIAHGLVEELVTVMAKFRRWKRPIFYPRRFVAVFLALLILCNGNLARADQLTADMLDRVFPGATHFGAMDGTPPAIPAYLNHNVIGYVFRTHAVVRSLGLSGKKLDILAGIDMDGMITGAVIVEHHEPILAIGVSSEDLETFVTSFTGRDVREPIRILRRPGKAPDALQAVSGATVSSLLMYDAIFQSARAIGQSRGILEGEISGIDLIGFEKTGWPELVADGSLTKLRLTVGEAEAPMLDKGAQLYDPVAGGNPDSLFIELWTGLATPARIGRNILGARIFNRLMGQLKEGDHLVFMAANGRHSFKGTSYIKTGRFDRIQITQGENNFQFMRDDHIRVEKLHAEGAPEFRESALFVIPGDSGFNPAEAWSLELIVQADGPGGAPVFTTHNLTYQIPDRYLAATEMTPIGRPSDALWQNVWLNRIPDVAFLLAMLGILGGVFFLQDIVVKQKMYYKIFRYSFLTVTLLWLGWYSMAQLSVLNVLTFAGALRTEFRWEFFLLEPLIFILWAFVAMSLLFGGRGAYCGWLCPFGALQELLNRIAQRFHVPQLRPPFGLHERLWPLKYIVFLGLFAVSLTAFDMAQAGAEVEPFKTAIVMRFIRQWPFVLYVLALLGAGLFIERAFCRYLCPLGAALAIPARIRMFEWLKRRWHCGRQCNICATKCPVQAIHPNGSINPNECIYCLNCQTIYYDDTICPPLIDRRKRRETRAEARAAEEPANAQ